MRHFLTATVTALEAALISLVGIVLIAIPTLLVGIVTMSLSVDLETLIRTITSIWVLAHEGQLGFVVSAQDALALGLTADPIVFEVGLAPLALPAGTAYFAWRIGRRHAEINTTAVATVIGGLLGFLLASTVIVVTSAPFLASSPALTVVVVNCWFAVPLLIGYFTRIRARLSPLWFRFKATLLPERVSSSLSFERYVPHVLSLTGVLLALVTAVTAVTFTFALILGFVDVVSLTQSLQLSVIGVFTVFLVQLMYLPTLLLWTLSWLSGVGFSLGTGSSVSPYETLLGPLPSIPVLAVIPEVDGSYGALVSLMLVLVGAVAGVWAGRTPQLARLSMAKVLAIATSSVMLTGLVLAAALYLSRGPIGPGRLAQVGPDPWPVSGLIAVELLVGLLLGVTLGRLKRAAGTVLTSSKVQVATEQEQREFQPLTPAQKPAQRTLQSEEADENETLNTGTGHESPEITEADTQPLSRIASPEESSAQPWFRKALKRKHNAPQGPSFDADDLAEEYAWKPPKEED